jgi:transposase InsO family protein/DNA-binding XRE family transcriptional regulator
VGRKKKGGREKGLEEKQEEEEHLRRVEAAMEASRVEAGRRSRRGMRGQEKKLEVERQVTAEAVKCSRYAVVQGWTKEEAALDLGLSRRTLCQWEMRSMKGELCGKPRGRRVRRGSVQERNQVIAQLRDGGPGLGVRPLGVLFPRMARGEIVDIQGRFRRVWEKRHRVMVSRLTWTRPGAVWSMDHTRLPCLVDGSWKSALTVRDLASGSTLGFVPQDEKAGSVIETLDGLREEHGAPLVIKSDNGSAFIANATRECLAMMEVNLLLSPPRTPRYNGSIEAAHRHLKARAAHVAGLRGRFHTWTWQDLEASRKLGNVLSFPRGHGSRSAEEVWRGREPITEEERARFLQAVRAEELQEKKARGLEPGAVLGPRVMDEIQRTAIVRALVARGFLFVRSREFPLPFNSKLRANIS